MENKISAIKRWFNKPYEFKKLVQSKFPLTSVFLVTGTSLTLSAVYYLSSFLQHFGIDYFKYFSATDIIRVLYDCFSSFYLLSIITIAVSSYLVVPYVATQLAKWLDGSSLPTNKSVIIVAFLFAWIAAYMLGTFIKNEFQFSSLRNIPFLILLFIIALVSIFISVKAAGVFLLFLPAFFNQKATYDIKRITSDPIKFEVTVVRNQDVETLRFDGAPLLFIFKADRALFYKDINCNKVFVIPDSRLLEVSFVVEE